MEKKRVVVLVVFFLITCVSLFFFDVREGSSHLSGRHMTIEDVLGSDNGGGDIEGGGGGKSENSSTSLPSNFTDISDSLFTYATISTLVEHSRTLDVDSLSSRRSAALYRVLLSRWNESSIVNTMLSIPASSAIAIATRRHLLLDWSIAGEGTSVNNPVHTVFSISNSTIRTTAAASNWVDTAAVSALDVSPSRLQWAIQAHPSDTFSIERDVFLFKKVVVLHSHSTLLEVLNTSTRYSNVYPSTLEERVFVMKELWRRYMTFSVKMGEWQKQYAPTYPNSDTNILILLPTSDEALSVYGIDLADTSLHTMQKVDKYVQSVASCVREYVTKLDIGHVHLYIGPRCVSSTLHDQLNAHRQIRNTISSTPCLNEGACYDCTMLEEKPRPRSCILGQYAECRAEQEKRVSAQSQSLGEVLAFASKCDLVVGSPESELVRAAAWAALASDRNGDGGSALLATGKPFTSFKTCRRVEDPFEAISTW